MITITSSTMASKLPKHAAGPEVPTGTRDVGAWRSRLSLAGGLAVCGSGA